MKARSKRLQPAADVAGTRERSAAKVWGDAQQLVKEQENKLAELKTYHDQYASNFQSVSMTGMGASQMQEYRSFLSRISEAIREQTRIVEGLRHQSEQQRQAWLKHRTKVQAIEKVLERCHQDEIRIADRKEQRLMDDRRRKL